MDTPEVIIIVLSAFAVVVWMHSWILDNRDDHENQPAAQRTTRLYHGEAMLGVEDF